MLKIIKASIHFRVLFLVVIFWNSTESFAQKDQKLDSLLNMLQIVKDDTGKVNLLNALSHHLWKISADYADAKSYADSALSLASKVYDNKGMAHAYHNLGIIYRNQNNYSEALNNLGKSLIKYNEIGYAIGVAYIYNSIGIIYKNLGNYPEALQNHFASLKIKKEIGDKRGIAQSYHNIGLIYKYLGNYPEALENHFAALKIDEEFGNKYGISSCLTGIGMIYDNQRNYTEALKNYFAALQICEELGEKKGISDLYNNIGLIYFHQGKYDEALNNHLASLKIKQEIGTKKGIAESYNNISNVYCNQGNYAKALTNQIASLKLMQDIGEKKGIANSYIRVGELYINIDSLDKAKKYLDDGLWLSKEIGSTTDLMEAYSGLAKLAEAQGNYELALLNYKLYKQYKDSILNESNSKAIAEMKTKYETEKKDKEIHQLESEKQISNLQLLVQQESLNRIQSEKAKIQAQNLFHLQQVELLSNEHKLQQLEIEKNQADIIAQTAETARKHDQVTLLNKLAEIQKLEIKKQTLLRNYLAGGFILFTLLGFFVYNNYKTRQKLKLQTLRNKIASDLHDDVGSTLSSISIFSEIAKDQSKDVIPLLDTIGESSRKMLDAMADIVWTINPENDQFEKIILRMRSFAYELLGAKGIDFEFTADEDVAKIKLPMEVRKNLYLIFKEATNNMVKYSNATKVMFRLMSEKDNFSMIICDNGKGFDMNKSTEGNGLRNMRKRAEEIGARLMIDSLSGNGTTIQFSISV